MQKPKLVVFSLPFVLFLLVASSYGQSLGDVAREQRQKQQAKDKDTPAAHKVVTNEDIPESPAASSNDVAADDSSSEPSAPTASTAGKKSADQWKAEIGARKARIAAMQSQVDKLNDSVHFVEANRYYNGVQYNQYQLKKQQEAQRMQKQLDGEKKALSDAQEAARKAGFGSAVYDPD
jgi:predicted nucleic acid-binding Zn ribbon protein